MSSSSIWSRYTGWSVTSSNIRRVLVRFPLGCQRHCPHPVTHPSIQGIQSSAVAAIPEISFPEGFLWGTATAAHQIEGGNVNNDWWAWEHNPDSGCAESSGDACDSLFSLARGRRAGCIHGAWRLSVLTRVESNRTRRG